MSTGKNAVMKSGAKEEASYNRFFVNAFSEQDIQEIVDEGGAENRDSFKNVSRDNIKDQGYWEAMFDSKFKGRDGSLRPSKFNRLGDAIFSTYFKQLKNDKVTLREYSRQGKAKTFYRVRRVVAKGERLTFKNKLYKGGQFLPKGFR